MAFNWVDTLRTVAPVLASLVGGPLAGTAVSALSNLLLERPDAPQEEIAQAIANATPETLAKLKQLDNDFNVQMKQLDIDLERLHAEDRQSARRREAEVQDWVPRTLALLIFLGFFCVLIALVFVEIPSRGEAPLNIMLGVLGGGITSILTYYYGSSAGSDKKTQILGEQIRNGSSKP